MMAQIVVIQLNIWMVWKHVWTLLLYTFTKFADKAYMFLLWSKCTSHVWLNCVVSKITPITNTITTFYSDVKPIGGVNIFYISNIYKMYICQLCVQS